MADGTPPADGGTPPPDGGTPPADPPAGDGGTPPADPPADDAAGLDPASAAKALKETRAEAKNLRARIKQLEAESEARAREQMTEHERALADAKKAGRDEALAEVLPELRELKITAAAAGKVVRPDLAVKLLPDDLDLSNAAALNKAIEGLVEQYPELAVGDGQQNPPPSFGGFPQGSQQTPPADGGKRNFTEDILKAAGLR